MIILLTILTFFSTLTGGLFAFQFKDRLRLIVGFRAGTVIGVCFFDLLPEAILLGRNHYKLDFISTIVALSSSAPGHLTE